MNLKGVNPPGWDIRWQEISAVKEFLGGMLTQFDLFSDEKPAPIHLGEEVILLPGFGASSLYFFLLHRELEKQGFTVRDWSLGLNDGNVERLLYKFAPLLESEYQKTGKPLTLIGWSLGGYIAREAARDNPVAVRKIITMGTPVVGGPRYTIAAKWYEKNGYDIDEIEKITIGRFENPLQIPIVAFYSKRDGVVAWQACIDTLSPNVEHIEVDCSHLGMGFEPTIVKQIAERAR
ncbi:MAG: alpha/beta fold hydrolase [Spirochaetota bacterium]